MDWFTWILVIAAGAVGVASIWGLVKPKMPKRKGPGPEVGMGGDVRGGYRGTSPDPNGPHGTPPSF